MLAFLDHCFQYAEVYAVVLTLIVIPLGYWASYLFLKNHFGLFKVNKAQGTSNGSRTR